MSNSNLVNYTRKSPNYTKMRGKKNTHIVIHHMAGNLSVETCGSVFASSSCQASSNYGIGSDGRIGLYVDESNRSWATANREIDSKAVTIEVANSSTGGNWPVSDKAMASLIDLCVDICKRNGIPRLNYTGDKRGNLHMHCWYAATACPGPYLKSKFGYIASEVNKRLAGESNESYLVRVKVKDLYIRTGPGTDNPNKGFIKPGVYTIVETRDRWGRLKSGVGWICLDYAGRL